MPIALFVLGVFLLGLGVMTWNSRIGGLARSFVPQPWLTTVVVLVLALVMFPGEGHGFREPASIIRATELETSFLGQVWGYQPDDDPEQVEVENL